MMSGNVSFAMQKEILREYPKNVRCYDEWLFYLNKMEKKVRELEKRFNFVSILLKLYEGAVSALEENWNNEVYLIIFFRKSILSYHKNPEDCLSLFFCAINARRNPQMMAALVYHYLTEGNMSRTNDLVNSSQKFLDEDGMSLLRETISLFKSNGDLQPLLGLFYYEPVINMDISEFTNVSSLQFNLSTINDQNNSNTIFLSKSKCTNENIEKNDDTLKFKDEVSKTSYSALSAFQTHSEPVNECIRSPRFTQSKLRLSTDTGLSTRAPLRLVQNNQTKIKEDQTEKALFPDVIKFNNMDQTEQESVHKDSWFSVSNLNDKCENSRFYSTIEQTYNPPNIYDNVASSCTSGSSTVLPADHNSSVAKVNKHDQKLTQHSQTQHCYSVLPKLSFCDVGTQTCIIGEALPELLTVNKNDYYVIKEIGRGGSSVVYSVLDSGRNIWAIKVVTLTNVTSELVTTYTNEIEILKWLGDSERVIHLHDYEQSADSIFMVMECANIDFKNILVRFLSVPEPTLGTSSASTGRMPSSAVVYYWEQMLRCVKALHDRDIVHLDLKPQNFVLVNGELKLIDLGISRRLLDDCTSVQQCLRLGTLTFMSPEQLEQSSGTSENSFLWSPGPGSKQNRIKVGRKSDIWSLGVILYIMVYAQSPFKQKTIQSRILAILNPNEEILFPPIKNIAIYQALKRSLVRDYKLRASIEELLSFDYQ